MKIYGLFLVMLISPSAFAQIKPVEFSRGSKISAADMNSNFKNVYDKANELDGKNLELAGKFSDQQTKIDEQKTLLDLLQTKVNEHQTVIDSGYATLTSLQNKITQHDASIASQNLSLGDKQVQINAHTSQIQGVQGQVSGINSLVNGHTNTLNVHQSNIVTLQAQSATVATHTSQISGIQNLANATSASLNALQANQADPATFRLASFSTFDALGWAMENNPAMFGGVSPSTWTDVGGQASYLASDKELLRTLFTQKGYANRNAMVMSDVYLTNGSNNGKLVATLFRIKNSTANTLVWTPFFYYSAYGGWGEYASLSLNGVGMWFNGMTGKTAVSLYIPANRTSTVIIISASGNPSQINSGLPLYTRRLELGFYNESLSLQPGLSFVDDLDTALNGWNN